MSDVDETLALVTLEQVKEYLKIDRDTEDGTLSDLVNSASALANSYTGRYLLKKSYIEFYDGNNSRRLFLRHYPVQKLTSIYDDISYPPTFPSITLVDPTDYQIQAAEGIIQRLTIPFYRGRGNVKVTYEAGYPLAQVPYDLALAVQKIVATEYKARYQDPSRLGLKSISQGDRTTTYIEDALTKDVTQVLDRYKRVGFASPAYS